MSLQDTLNLSFAIIGALGGWAFTSLRDAMSDLRKSYGDIVTKLQQVELLVAGEYVKKTDMERLTESLFKKLDRIEAKIDLKADKPH